VEQSLARSALASAEVDWDELARDTRNKKFRAKPKDAQDRARQMRFLEYRGCDAAQIRQALRQAATDEDL
jgi:regulatory protein